MDCSRTATGSWPSFRMAVSFLTASSTASAVSAALRSRRICTNASHFSCGHHGGNTMFSMVLLVFLRTEGGLDAGAAALLSERSEDTSSEEAEEDEVVAPSPDTSPTRRLGEPVGGLSGVEFWSGWLSDENLVSPPRLPRSHSSFTMRLENQQGPSTTSTSVTGDRFFPACLGVWTYLTGPRSAPFRTHLSANSLASRRATPAARASSAKGQRTIPYSLLSCRVPNMSIHAPRAASEQRRKLALLRQSAG